MDLLRCRRLRVQSNNTHTYQKKLEEEIRKKQAMSMVPLNLACFQNENHGYLDVAPIKQKKVSHTDLK